MFRWLTFTDHHHGLDIKRIIWINMFGVIQNIMITMSKTIRMIKMTVMVLLVTLIASSALQLEMEWAGEGIEGEGGTYGMFTAWLYCYE